MKLIKMGKKWWVDYTANGKRHRQSTHTENKKIAQAWMDSILVARKMPTFESAVEVLKMLYKKPVEGLLPVETIWENYTRIAKATGKWTSEKSAKQRKYRVDGFLRWLAAARPTVKTIETVTGPIAAAYAEKLANDGLKTKTRRNIIGDLSTVWRMLEKASAQIRNPWPNLAPVDTDGERGKAFTLDEERRVLEAARRVGRDWYPVCVLMRHTGLRYGDVARLTWGEIQGDVIRLLPHKTKRHKIAVAIPLTQPAKEAIAELTRRGDFLFPLHSELYGDEAATLRQNLRFRDVLELAGIRGRGYTIHSWRHTAATRLAASGVDIETRKRILGHTVDATARRYDHDEHLDETRQALESAAG